MEVKKVYIAIFTLTDMNDINGEINPFTVLKLSNILNSLKIRMQNQSNVE